MSFARLSAATSQGAILLLVLLISACSQALPVDSVKTQAASTELTIGAAQLDLYLPLLANKRVGLLVNQTATVDELHLVDLLLQQNINIETIFAPEHGFRGNYDAGAQVNNSIDSKTGLKIVSLYGANKAPTPTQLTNIDVLVFDIQDVGVRYYTYISSLHYFMQAAAAAKIPLLVLDRPNPNAAFIDGPVLDLAYQSFVGMHPIPLLHGMTVGELALMIKGEAWIKQADNLQLTVIPLSNYRHDMAYSLPVKPSPNLPNDQAIALYPSLGFFEATPLSIGRGTDFPFQVIGYDKFSLANFSFTPVSTPGAALTPPLMNTPVLGQDLRQVHSQGLNLSYLINWYQLFKQHNAVFFSSESFMDKLAGTNKLRLQIEQGLSEEQIRQSWQADLVKFKQQRQPYLLYP
ncbi:exo-beta-N-acetylmuramidase NamZ family protein [Rheinheimera sp. WS51]|uniref:exo-beta-N-acetylmuramidase NamZ family protein n=1 Tax=Rheinheimera sp. WS51 TaxID=3425886 RepID=UPI003D9140BD